MNFPGFSPGELTQRELFDSAIVALSMTRADTSFVAVNDAYARLFGYDSPRALMDAAPLATDLYVDARDRGRVVAEVEKNGSVSDFEVRMRRRDGEVRWMSIGMSAIRDADGAFVAFHAALFDVTEKRAARERARLEERRLRTVLELLPLSVSLSDENGTLVLGGGSLGSIWQGDIPKGRERFARYKGRWARDGKPVQPDEWPVVRALDHGETRVNDEIEIDTFDGGSKIIRNWAAPVRDAEGRVTGVVAINEDITARKRDEALLRLEQQVTLRFAQAKNVGAALQAAIRAICETERWEAGRYLSVDAARNVLVPGEAWCVPVASIQRYIDESQKREYATGVGLVGHVWQTGEPLWVPDISKDPRVARPHLAGDTGMRGSVVFPVHADGRTIGVFIFDSREIRKPDARLLRTLSLIGGQVGLLVRRAQAEEALRESEARFRGLTALSADWYWEQDAQFRLTYMSQHMSEKTGLPSLPYIGQRRWDQPALNLDEEGWAAHRRQLERHEPFKDFEMQRPDGKGGSRWVSLTGEPVFDADGRFAGYRGVGKDITERKEQDKAVRESEALKSAILGSAMDGIVSIDGKGRLLEFNAAAESMFGWAREEVLGKNIEVLIPAELRDAHREGLRRLQHGGDGKVLGRRIEVPALRRDGSRFDAELSILRIRGMEPAVYTGTLRDITERKRAEEERERVGRMYASLSAVNELVARARGTDELLKGACEIAVSSGDFKFALVRMPDEAKGVAPMVAYAGADQAPWLNRALSLDPASPDAESLAVRAWRTGAAATAADEALTRRALFAGMTAKTGSRAAGAYPLWRGGVCVGALLLNSSDPQAFEGEMGELLERMARNVSQGLDLLQAGDELRRFRLAVDQSADMMALVDVETLRYLDVNDTMCKALGYSREELLALHPYDLLPMTREELAASYRSIIEGPGHAALLSEYRRRDGSIMPIESFRSVLRAGGRYVIVANARDISERLAREQALTRLTRMYAALSSLNEAIPRIRDARGVLQQACEIAAASGHFVRAAVRLLDRESGRTRAVAWSGPGSSELAHFSATTDPGFPEGRSLVAEALRTGEARVTNDFLGDPRTYLIRGTPAAEGTRSVGAFPLRMAGQVTGVLILHGLESNAFDDDMRALLERMAQSLSFALENLEAESRFRQTFELAATGIAHVGIDRRFIRVNQRLCDMLGYRPEELIGMTGRDISHPQDRDVVNAERARLYSGEVEDLRVEKRYLRKDGGVVWVALTVALARDAHGAPAYEILIIEDISDRKRDQRLLALEHEVTRCLAQAETKSAGVQGLIRAVCESNGWPVGRYFVPDADGEALRFDEGWAGADPDAGQFLERSRSTTYAPGVGLSGWVWQKNVPLWVADVASDPRTAPNARPASFRRGGAMVFPVAAGGATLGVLSFSRPDPTPPDERLLKAMGVIASQLGQFVVKKRGEEERAALRERDQSLVRALGEIIYDWRPDEEAVRWEGEYQRILGYAEMGEDTDSWTSRVHPEDLELVMGEVEAATLERRNYDLQYRFRRADGRYLWMHDRGVCTFDADGELVRIIGVLADIDARKKSEHALRGIVQASAEPLLLVRKDGTAQFVNPAAEALFGRSAKELEGAMLGLPLADGRPAEVEIVLPGGGVRPAEMQFASTELEGQELLVVSLHDLSERKRYESHIEHLANHDTLTSLPNRTLLRDRVEQAIAHAKRAGGHVGLMFVDLDQFKLVNDSWGHAAGDRLLLEVAQRLQRTVRDGDTVARLGGDEFVVLLPDLARADNTSVVARKVADALDKPLLLDGRELRLTASIGIALFPDDGDSLDSLLQCADAAMYRAKDAGRNGYQYYSADMGKQARARVETEAGLRVAIERGDLRLHYQPQVDLRSGEVKGFEALMRWEHPARGMVSPMEFIPVAEESGLILPMGEWALLEACREAKAWLAGGFGSLKVAVNLSARQFWRGSVTEAVRNALGASGLAPAQLEIEITESVVARDLQNVMLQLEQLRRMGVSIAIDDFGTGYSSLAYLRSLPINKVKIDKSFIKGIPGDREATALVAEIVRLAHILSLEVVAEGVETAAQADFLRASDCEAMQGYLFARPLPAPECAALLRAGRRLEL